MSSDDHNRQVKQSVSVCRPHATSDCPRWDVSTSAPVDDAPATSGDVIPANSEDADDPVTQDADDSMTSGDDPVSMQGGVAPLIPDEDAPVALDDVSQATTDEHIRRPWVRMLQWPQELDETKR